MPSTFTSILRLEKQANGEGQGVWGARLNTVIDLVEAALAGAASIVTTGGDTTLTTNNSAADQARCMFLLVTGTLVSNANIIVPNQTKLYVVRNATAGAFTVSVKTSSGGALAIAAGSTAFIWCDGSNVVAKVAPNTILGLLDCPSSFSGQSGRQLRVNSGETAIEFVVPAEDQVEFSSATAIIFSQAAAPLNWTQDNAVSDRMLRVTSGAGNGVGGTWFISGIAIGATTLSTVQMPSHQHQFAREGFSNNAPSGNGRNTAAGPFVDNTTLNGGNSSHDHSASHNGAWRPAYLDIIRCVKN